MVRREAAADQRGFVADEGFGRRLGRLVSDHEERLRVREEAGVVARGQRVQFMVDWEAAARDVIEPVLAEAVEELQAAGCEASHDGDPRIGDLRFTVKGCDLSIRPEPLHLKVAFYSDHKVHRQAYPASSELNLQALTQETVRGTVCRFTDAALAASEPY
jgi:hypothetical protein